MSDFVTVALSVIRLRLRQVVQEAVVPRWQRWYRHFGPVSDFWSDAHVYDHLLQVVMEDALEVAMMADLEGLDQ